MKKAFKRAICVVAGVAISASASSYSLWNLSNCASNLETGGWMYTYDDFNDGGTSKVDMPSPSEEADVFGEYLCENDGAIKFITTDAFTYSFAGIGFNWKDPKEIWNPTTAGGGDEGGISLCYISQKDMIVELKAEKSNSNNANPYENDNFVATLPKTSKATHIAIKWKQFAQGDWDSGIPEPDGVLGMLEKYSMGIHFKFEGGGEAAVNTFHLGGIGWYNDPDDCENGEFLPVLSTVKHSGFDLIQNGRMLSFSGLKKASVEVYNIHGAVVAKLSVNEAKNNMNLANLTAGIYMVRVKGEGVNYVNKILLK